MLRGIFSTESAATWFIVYWALVIASIGIDWANDQICQHLACPFPMPHALLDTPRHATTLFGIAGYLITAQAGALAVLSIAVSLVTLIGQSGNEDVDVRVYYNESLTFPLVASSVILLLVLCLQVVWPLHKIASLLHVSGGTLAPQTDLTLLHIVWFCLNMAAFARFALVSLSFGDAESRAFHRRQYTANQLVPEALRQQLMSARFNILAGSLEGEGETNRPSVWFSSMGSMLATTVQMSANMGEGRVLHDVWTTPLRIALNSWIRRSMAAHVQGNQYDALSFMVQFGRVYAHRSDVRALDRDLAFLF